MPRGLYLYGDVGTGKSMLMDLFYNTLPSNIKRKRRVHFNAFMIDVHKRVHALKAKYGDTGVEDPILLVARDLANEASVLCLDEFQVRGGGSYVVLCFLLNISYRSQILWMRCSYAGSWSVCCSSASWPS